VQRAEHSPTQSDGPTAGEMLEETLDIVTGVGILVLPLIILAVPALVLLLPLLLLLALPLAIALVILVPPYLVVRSLRRWRRSAT
jgi:Flp pilus assembly protein TadB